MQLLLFTVKETQFIAECDRTRFLTRLLCSRMRLAAAASRSEPALTAA